MREHCENCGGDIDNGCAKEDPHGVLGVVCDVCARKRRKEVELFRENQRALARGLKKPRRSKRSAQGEVALKDGSKLILTRLAHPVKELGFCVTVRHEWATGYQMLVIGEDRWERLKGQAITEQPQRAEAKGSSLYGAGPVGEEG